METPNGTVNTQGQDDYDYGVGVGGRIITDRLFFYGTINPQHQSRTFTAPPDFPLVSLGEVDRERRIVTYAGKVTYQPMTAHRVDFSVFGDPAKGDNGPQRNNALLAVACGDAGPDGDRPSRGERAVGPHGHRLVGLGRAE